MKYDTDVYDLDQIQGLLARLEKFARCKRRKVAAIAVNKQGQIIARAYNEPPRQIMACTESDCYRIQNNIPSGQDLDKCKAIHAEAWLALQCKDLAGASVFVSCQPCTSCFKLLLAAGVQKIVWFQNYNDSFSKSLMAEAGRIVCPEDNITVWIRGKQ